MIEDMLFQGWQGVLRTFLVGTLAYFGLVASLRISGKRTLAKLNAFDLVVTVAIGSTLASILLSKDVALAEGLTAYATLIGLQYAVAWISVRRPRMADLLRSEPSLVMRDGQILPDALRRERVTENELMMVIRGSAAATPDQVAAVILETDGSFSVIPKPEDGGRAKYADAGLDI